MKANEMSIEKLTRADKKYGKCDSRRSRIDKYHTEIKKRQNESN